MLYLTSYHIVLCCRLDFKTMFYLQGTLVRERGDHSEYGEKFILLKRIPTSYIVIPD